MTAAPAPSDDVDDAVTPPGTPRQRLYGDLAEWWPLISPPEEYAGEALTVLDMMATALRPVLAVLELGCGGGHLASHLGRGRRLTLVDRSEQMLAVSRQLNSGAEHLVGDMRTLRLGRTFDAVLIHDAVDYMCSEQALAAALATAAEHCRPGGVLVVMPDHLADSFEPRTDHGGSDAADGRGARYLEWTWDPDPSDTTIQTEYAFLLRAGNGSVTVVEDQHVTGLFPLETWVRLLSEAGFDPIVTFEEDEDWGHRTSFVAHLPDPSEGVGGDASQP